MNRPTLLLRRLFLLTLASAIMAAAGWSEQTFFLQHNFRVAGDGLYRSAQLRGAEWQDSATAFPYRSILNLQGEKPQAHWYQHEVQFAADRGIAHYDFELSAHVAPTLQAMQDLVAIMQAAPKPILVHCKNGADRSGLAAALYRLAIEGVAPEIAAGQLSIWYGHAPWFDGRSQAMDDAFASFVAAVPHRAGRDFSAALSF